MDNVDRSSDVSVCVGERGSATGTTFWWCIGATAGAGGIVCGVDVGGRAPPSGVVRWRGMVANMLACVMEAPDVSEDGLIGMSTSGCVMIDGGWWAVDDACSFHVWYGVI